MLTIKERPILFSGEMVRAILDGRKAQTRRLVKPQPTFMGSSTLHDAWHWACKKLDAGYCHTNRDAMARLMLPHCHYGEPGDRIWVKETWRPRGVLSPWDLEVTYAADGAVRLIKDGEFGDNDWNMPKAAAHGNVSPLFMPRWASRILLEVVSVRVERLQEISEADARAEGRYASGWVPTNADPDNASFAESKSAKDEFFDLWERINGAGSWAANPWVWVIEFRRVAPC